MNDNFTVTLHLGIPTKTGFETQFKLIEDVKGDTPYKTAETIMALLDGEVIEKTGFKLVLDINGVFIPNDFGGKGYTVEEAYYHTMLSDMDLLLGSLKDTLKGEHSND